MSRILAAEPSLDIRVGDVRALPLGDATFDAVVSQGVIEHFVEGYAAILDETARVLRQGGVAIVGFPALNPLRRLKVRCGAYPAGAGGSPARDGFYQFALDPRRVERDLVSRGFAVLERTWYEGFLGLADEAPAPLAGLMRSVYNDRRSRWCSAARRLAEPLCARWAGYCHQIVARRGPT